MTGVTPFLEAFDRLSRQHPGPVPESVSLDCGTLSGRSLPKSHTQHAVFGSIIHGNETGSLPAIVSLIEDLTAGRVPYRGKVTFFLGNVPAALQDKRSIEADLNRVFTSAAPDSAEKRRALELMPVIASADVFFDFHQTIQPSIEPFYIFKYHRASYLWARLAGVARVMVTRSPRTVFESGSLCSDEFAHSQGVAGVTLELGRKGITPQASAWATTCMHRVLAALDALATRKGTHQLERLAARRTDFSFFTTVHKEPFGDPKNHMVPGLQNFSWVERGQELAQISGRGMICAQDTGVILFPKYPDRDPLGNAVAPVPGDLYHLAKPLQRHPEKLWGLQRTTPGP